MDKKLEELLTRGVQEIVVEKDLQKKLESGRKLRIKHGVDPTTKDLHLGHAVIYEKLRQFQELGHKIVFLIGGFTGRFGDPSDKTKTRMMRDKKEVSTLAKNYLVQVGKIINLEKAEVRDNSEWYDKMSAENLLRLMSEFTALRMLERDMFQKRIKAGEKIGLHELVYPILQGYDSVMLKADLTIIGADQKFNELQARPLQEKNRQAPQDLIMMPLLIGTDGEQKMSQSLGNDISISEHPYQQYGKIMSITDEQIIPYFTLVTREPLSEIKEMEKEMKRGKLNPRDAKAMLARAIVTICHSTGDAQNAESEFNRVYRDKESPSVIVSVSLSPDQKELTLLELVKIYKFFPSNSECRRKILEGAIKIDGVKKTDPKEIIKLQEGMIVQGGKRFERVGFRNKL
ncbi:MAG: hypothetical protein ACD_68C00061G0001 [uncultured bacterium]|nr:MAG: hypothetical protein ACD_68C00061G0001 [uncultured bacterium]